MITIELQSNLDDTVKIFTMTTRKDEQEEAGRLTEELLDIFRTRKGYDILNFSTMSYKDMRADAEYHERRAKEIRKELL